MSKAKILVLLAVVALESFGAVTGATAGKEGHFAFASYYGDHMVLQRGPQRANIWGYSPKIGDHVTVTVNGQHSVSTTVVHGVVHTGGIWTVKLPAFTQHGPFVIKAQSSVGVITLNDVLFGDVWICSGQSNMAVTVGMIMNASAEIADADHYPNIRLMTVSHHAVESTQTDLNGIQQHWTHANHRSVGGNDWNYFSAVCWLYGKYLYKHRGYPIGLVASDWGATPIEPWATIDSLKSCGVHIPNPIVMKKPVPGKLYFPTEPAVIWNTMMAPLTKMTMYGVIWYQGESNANRANAYKCTFPALINDWRKKFHHGSGGETDATFPFGFVQIAPNDKDPHIGHFPALRWAQTYDFGYVPNNKMKKVFMAVTIDLPDFNGPHGALHPRYKQDIGLRLGLAAEAVAYGVSGVKYQGPFPTHIRVNADTGIVNIEFDHGNTPIDVRSNDGFEVCCSSNAGAPCHESDSQWKKVPIVNHFTSSIQLYYRQNCGHDHVLGVRYAWLESPCNLKKCAIYSKDNSLPAPPYISIGHFT